MAAEEIAASLEEPELGLEGVLQLGAVEGIDLGTSENKMKTSEAKASWSARGSREAGPCGLASPSLNINWHGKAQRSHKQNP